MDNQILKLAIAKWGRDVQINKIQEEALELALVLNQMKCPTKDLDKMEENLYDELADMKIMMAQAELIFDADRINKRVEFKLNKLKEKYFNQHKDIIFGHYQSNDRPSSNIIISKEKYDELHAQHLEACKLNDFSNMIMIGSKDYDDMKAYEAQFCRHNNIEEIQGGQIERCRDCGKTWG